MEMDLHPEEDCDDLDASLTDDCDEDGFVEIKIVTTMIQISQKFDHCDGDGLTPEEDCDDLDASLGTNGTSAIHLSR